MPYERGFELRGADVQLVPVVLPQRLFVDAERTADMELRNAPRGEHLDEAALHVRRNMRGPAGGDFRVFHRRPGKNHGRPLDILPEPICEALRIHPAGSLAEV